MKRLLIVSLLLVAGRQAYAQDSLRITRDTIVIEENKDTVLIQSYAKRYNPRKALLYAAILPGLGQVYNKKYWKLPLVYGGFYLIGNGINYYNDIYKTYKVHLFSNLENNVDRNQATGLSTTQLRRIVDKARRERDFMVILMGGMYILQMIDAHVDAHLKEFDLNPNLRVSVEPTMRQDQLLGRQTGVSVVFRF
jgi:hypothetical protein